jgi:hypothetical protein
VHGYEYFYHFITGRFEDPMNHYDVMEYEYNTLGHMSRQKSPDGGETHFFYDQRGKVRLSQNSKQAAASTWSYTKYDELARVVESGEISGYGSPLTNDVNDRNFPYDGGAYPKEFVTKTTYTQPCTIWLPDYGVFSQEHLQNRISYTITDRDANAGTTDDRVVSIYSYDPHGNVKSLVQYIGNAASAVCMDYQYDVVSNKVIKMNQRKLFLPVYQPGWLQEDFTQHRYSYDGDKRLVYYWDGFDNSGWLQRNAAYQYYMHGPRCSGCSEGYPEPMIGCRSANGIMSTEGKI